MRDHQPKRNVNIRSEKSDRVNQQHLPDSSQVSATDGPVNTQSEGWMHLPTVLIIDEYKWQKLQNRTHASAHHSDDDTTDEDKFFSPLPQSWDELPVSNGQQQSSSSDDSYDEYENFPEDSLHYEESRSVDLNQNQRGSEKHFSFYHTPNAHQTTNLIDKYQIILATIKSQLSQDHPTDIPQDKLDQLTQHIYTKFYLSISAEHLGLAIRGWESSAHFCARGILEQCDPGWLLCLLTLLFKEEVNTLYYNAHNDEIIHLHKCIELVYDAFILLEADQWGGTVPNILRIHLVLSFLNMALPALESPRTQFSPSKLHLTTDLVSGFFKNLDRIIERLLMVDFIHRNNELYHRVLITLIDNLTKKQSILSQFNMTHCVNTLKELKNCQLDSLRTKHNTLFYTLIKSDKTPTFGNTENAIHLTLDYLERSLDIHITQRAQQLGRRIQYSNNRITNEGNRSIVAALALFSTINETRDAIQFHFIEKLFIQYRLFYSATSGQYQPVLAIENNQIIEKHPHDLIQILTLFFRITLAKIDINRGPLFATLFHFVRTVRCLQEGLYLLTLLHRSHHPAIIQFLNNSIESIDNTTMNHCFSGFFKLPSINSRDQLAKPLKNPIYHYLGWEELSTKTPDIFKLLSDRITTPTDQSALQSRQLLNNLRHNTWRKLFRMNQPIEPRTNNDNHQHPINHTQHSHSMNLLPSWIYSKGIGKMKRQNTSTTENNFVPFEITKKM